MTSDSPLTTAGARDPSVARWAVVPLLMGLAFISHFNRVSMATAGDTRIMKQYQIEPTQMGMIYSAFLVAYTIAMLPGGLFIDRFRPRVALMVVGFGSAVFVALTGVVGLSIRDGMTAFATLLVVRALMGVVSSPLHPALASAVGRWVPPDARSRTNGMVNGSALLGIAATPLVFGAMVRQYGWPSAFLLAACATAMIAAAWSWLAGETTAKPAPKLVPAGEESTIPAGKAFGEPSLWTNRSLILLTLSYAAVSYFQYLFFYWMNYYFQSILNLPESRSQAYAAIPPLAMALGMPLGGWLNDRVERRLGPGARRIVPMAGMTVGSSLLVLGVFATEPAWIVTWFALALGAVGMSEGPFWVTAIDLGGRRGGSSAAFFNTGGNLGGLLAPVLTPRVGLHFGWGTAVGLGALVCLAGVLLWLGVDTTKAVPTGGTPDQEETPVLPANALRAESTS